MNTITEYERGDPHPNPAQPNLPTQGPQPLATSLHLLPI